MDAQVVALFVVGFVQPVLQEAIIGRHLSDAAAHWVTIGVSAGLALLAVWITGGLAGGQVPTFTLIDPSPLLGFLVEKIAPVYALSQIVYGGFTGTVKKLAGTMPLTPMPAPTAP